MPTQWNLDPYYRDRIHHWEEKRSQLIEAAEAFTAKDLPLKYLRQMAHFTTPASNFDMVKKAVESGSKATAKILDKLNISTNDLAEKIGVPVKIIEDQLNLTDDYQAPLVMVDGEDAQALRDDVVERGRENAIKVFREADWNRTLRFYRPSGLNLKYCIEDLSIVLTEAAKGYSPEEYPIDGIIWPKTEHPEQLAFICEILKEIEHGLGLEENQIKLQFLVESGWGCSQLPALVKTTVHRLAGIIWGIADYSADIGLPHIINDHPVCDWVRCTIINLAGAVGVPAIDNMTVNYPVANKDFSAEQNREMILDRLKECYDDAVHGQELGMDGKWVGHPAQLFMVRLAYRVALPEEEIANEVAKIEAYTKAVDAELGATIIKGVMSDRATDRHARNKLRMAIAIGHLDAKKGLEIGLITEAEAKQLLG